MQQWVDEKIIPFKYRGFSSLKAYTNVCVNLGPDKPEKKFFHLAEII
jgi:hypothetical protein